MLVGEAIHWASQELIAAGVPNARWDAELLLAHLLGKPPLSLVMLRGEPVTPEIAVAYRALIARRATREPLQYIIGAQEFMGLDLKVDGRVLVPRPETELLVEAALAALAKVLPGLTGLPVADICTGSGAIAIALASQCPRLTVFATDISPGAIEVASANARNCGVSDRMSFHTGDLFAPLPVELAGQLALVVSNPPYISTTELASLQDEVQREPQLALDGGHDGLVFFRRLVAETPRWLRPGGLLALEIGSDQGEALLDMLCNAGQYDGVSVSTDYAGHDRVVLAWRRGES